MVKTLEEKEAKEEKEKTPEEKRLERIIKTAQLTPAQFRNIAGRIEKPHHRLPHHMYDFSKKSTKILLIGDLHLNAKDPNTGEKKCDFKRLKEVYKIGREEGAEYVIQTGDVTDGENMRSDQKYGLVVQGADNVIKYCANEWPESGLVTYFIAGNHDQSYEKSIGLDICERIARERRDLNYLGMNEGNIPLQSNLHEVFFSKEPLPSNTTWIRIRHPSKGTAKGQSYQVQEHIGALQSSFKPQILVIGHYHKMDYLYDRGVHAFQAGTMEKQSDWMRTKDIAAHLGAWFVEIFHDSNGRIDRIKKEKLLYEVNGKEKWGKHLEYGIYEE